MNTKKILPPNIKVKGNEQNKKVEEAILQVANGISATVGEKFFRSLSKHLTNILKVDYAYIAEFIRSEKPRAKTLSLIADGKVLENIDVDLSGTPCETLLKKNICSIPSGVIHKYPRAVTMASMDVDGYVGISLKGTMGDHIGLLSVMHRSPIKHIQFVKAMLRIFALRAAAELERKRAEAGLLESRAVLRMKAKELEESNAALKVLLKQRENDKKEFEENILFNIKHLVMPYIGKLKQNKSMSEELVYLNTIESNLKEIISPFSLKLSSTYIDLTPKEIQIADLTKGGRQDKEIAELLSISIDTVKYHKKNIRKKVGIYGKRTNLRTFLASLPKE